MSRNILETGVSMSTNMDYTDMFCLCDYIDFICTHVSNVPFLWTSKKISRENSQKFGIVTSVCVCVLYFLEVCWDFPVPVVIIISVSLDVSMHFLTVHSASEAAHVCVWACLSVCTVRGYQGQMRCTSALMNCDSSCQAPLLLLSSPLVPFSPPHLSWLYLLF